MVCFHFYSPLNITLTLSGHWIQEVRKRIPQPERNTYVGTDLNPALFPRHCLVIPNSTSTTSKNHGPKLSTGLLISYTNASHSPAGLPLHSLRLLNSFSIL